MTRVIRLFVTAGSLAVVATVSGAAPARMFPCAACAETCDVGDAVEACNEYCFGWPPNGECYPDPTKGKFCDGEVQMVVECELN